MTAVGKNVAKNNCVLKQHFTGDFSHKTDAKSKTKFCDICNRHFSGTAYYKHRGSNILLANVFLVFQLLSGILLSKTFFALAVGLPLSDHVFFMFYG